MCPRGVDIGASTAGVEVTLIDFTLSRLRTADGAGAFCDLAADPELFQGPRGDCQVSNNDSQIRNFMYNHLTSNCSEAGLRKASTLAANAKLYEMPCCGCQVSAE